MIKLRSILSDLDLLPKLANFLAGCVALVLLIGAAWKPWLAVPVGVGGETSDSALTIYFKIGIGVFFLIYFILSKGKLHLHRLAYLSVFGLLVSLWYPSWVTMRDSRVMGDAAWLQQQHDNLTWLGGDVYRAHSERSGGWGEGVNAQDPPSRLALYRPPEGSLSPERITDWIWWLGYGPAFTQFVGKGWFLAVFGFFLALVCLIGFSWRRRLGEARVLLRRLLSRSGVLALLLLSVNVVILAVSGRALDRSKAFLAQGDYEASEVFLEKAVRWLPSLICDSGVLRQRDYLALKNGRESASFSLYSINQFEEEGYYARARDLLGQQAERWDRLPPEVTRELLRHEVRVAVNEMNSGRYEQAGARLDRVMEAYPHVLQARFHRQLIALHTGELEVCREMNLEIMQLYEKFKSKNKRGVIAASWLMSAQCEMDHGNVMLAREARQKSKGL